MDKADMTAWAAPVRAALDFALPPRCPGCGTIVAADHQFCAPCWTTLDFLGGAACQGCGVPFRFDRGAGARCAACLADPPPHDGVRAVVSYGEVARTVALKLKHGRRLAMGGIIARHVARLAAPDPDAILVPVPLHRWRLWRRGFNQSLVIARGVARLTGQHVADDLLVRQRATPMLRGLGRSARAQTLRGAFAVPSDKRPALRGRTVLLVDDVYTSGATAGACARALKRAGAARVVVLAWARVLDGDTGLGDERV
jgi:ComF family protein